MIRICLLYTSLADELRDKITAMGYTVEETRQGTVIKKK